MTDTEGKAVVNNLPLGSYYMKETIAGDHFVLNPEQKEFTLTAEDDTQAVVYEGVAYKNERQKISISVEKKDAVTEEKLEGVIFGLYAKEDILSQQGEVLVEKDTLLEKKATDEKGQLTFDSDLYGIFVQRQRNRHLCSYGKSGRISTGYQLHSRLETGHFRLPSLGGTAGCCKKLYQNAGKIT